MKPDIQEVTNFLMDYSVAMISAGTYAARVNKSVTRIANAFGYDVALTIFLKSTTLTVLDPDDFSIRRTYVRKNNSMSINFKLILKLSALSWHIYDDRFNLEEARRYFREITAEKRHTHLSTLMLVSVANAAFSRLFGGDLGAILVVFITTFIGFNARFLLGKLHVDLRLQYLAVSFLVSYLAYMGFRLGLTATYDVAIASSVLFLIPGVYFINSVIEVLNENTLVAISRAINIGILIICIAIGIFATISITNIGTIDG